MTVFDQYPRPWRIAEAWSGTLIIAANGARVTTISKGSTRIDLERAVATLICDAVNAYEVPS